MESKRRRDREDARDDEAFASPEDRDEQAALEQLLKPRPPVRDRRRGGTAIGRDLDH